MDIAQVSGARRKIRDLRHRRAHRKDRALRAYTRRLAGEARHGYGRAGTIARGWPRRGRRARHDRARSGWQGAGRPGPRHPRAPGDPVSRCVSAGRLADRPPAPLWCAVRLGLPRISTGDSPCRTAPSRCDPRAIGSRRAHANDCMRAEGPRKSRLRATSSGGPSDRRRDRPPSPSSRRAPAQSKVSRRVYCGVVAK